jgi:hypothetical protein
MIRAGLVAVAVVVPFPESPMSPPAAPVHKPPGSPPHVNALIDETSPYLLQHAHNPVHWRPWGPPAFEAARAQDKPIFLSIGYSTCYWCHVMERESFENEAIARLMNDRFVCIKVDREERPDVDDIYMAAVQTFTQLTTGRAQGGWPMSVFLDPHTLKPYFAGTYYPPEPGFGRPSFPQLITHLSDAWRNQREQVVAQSERLAELVAEQLSAAEPPVPVGREHVDLAVDRLLAMHDPRNGGFGGAPKFPQPVFLELLMGAAWHREDVRQAVQRTLDRMATGGMYDQVGGGFHRYSVDERWLVPHFEKMLYDNGQLASVYAAAFERTGEPFYAAVVRQTLDYVVRVMTSPEGAFFTAQDAEVQAREGGSYLWNAESLRAALAAAGAADESAFAARLYGVDAGPNFRDPHHPDESPANVLFLQEPPAALARELGMPLEELNARRRAVNAALLAARDRRDQPATDDKVLAGWNGLMIAGMADGGRVLGEARYVDAAQRAATFILSTMRDGRGGLLRSSRGGAGQTAAFLEDYALLIRGLLALHRATSDLQHLEAARRLAAEARQRFRDEVRGGYFDTPEGNSELFVRAKSTHDGAVPGGNSMMLLNLIDLHERTGDASYLNDAAAALAALSHAIADHPLGPALATLGLHRMAERYPALLPRKSADAAAAPLVRVHTDVEEVRVAPDQPARLHVSLEVAAGYHVNAHEPGVESLVGLEIEVIGHDGLRAEVEYPVGEMIATPLGQWRVHSGTVRVPVTIRQVGPAAPSAAPRLIIRYQACTEAMCLKPVVEAIPLRLRGE